jgi:hypothetical protein
VVRRGAHRHGATGSGLSGERQCLDDLLRLGERLSLVVSGEAPARFRTGQAFTHQATRSQLPEWTLATGASDWPAARRVVEAAIKQLSRRIERQLQQHVAESSAGQLRVQSQATCSFCESEVERVAAHRSVAVCSSCAEAAAALLSRARGPH